MNIKLVALFLITALRLPQLYAMEYKKEDTVKILTWTAATIGTQKLSQLVTNTKLSRQLEEETNLSLSDIALTGNIACTLMATSYLLAPDRKAKVQHFATRFPLAVVVGKLLTSKFVKQYAQQLPLLHYYLGCTNAACTGSCNSCTLKSMILITGIIRMTV
jgi:hypothetical protein